MAEAQVTKTVRYPVDLYQEFEESFPGEDFSEHNRRALRLYLRARREALSRKVDEQPIHYGVQEKKTGT